MTGGNTRRKTEPKTQHSVLSSFRLRFGNSSIGYRLIRCHFYIAGGWKKWPSMVGTRYIASIAYYCNILNAFVFGFDPNEYEYFLSVLGMLTVWF